MLLGPVKALYNIKYYLSGLNKSVWKAILFNIYLFAITAVFVAVITYFTGKPVVDNAVDKVAYYTPEITVQQGVATVNNDEPLLIEPKELEGFNVLFDTGRTEPLYPTEMTQSKTILAVTSDTAYLNIQDQFEATEIPEDFNMTITPQTILQNKNTISSIILYTITIIIVLAQIIKIPLLILIGFIMTAIVNAFTRAALPPAKLFKLACYMQAPVTALYILNFASPVKMPLLFLVYLIIFGLYAHMVISKYNPDAQEEQEEKEESEPLTAEKEEDDEEENPLDELNAEIPLPEDKPLEEEQDHGYDTEDKK